MHLSSFSRTALHLWRDEGADVWDFLMGRGLTPESIEAARLGFNTEDQRIDRSAWGLPPEEKPLWIPAGLVIPWNVGGDVHRIRIRRMDDSDCRYVIVSGSTKQPMRLGRLNKVILVESDLDAILVNPKAGDLVTAISLGSVSLRPDTETHERLKAAELILLALDADAAASGQVSWWAGRYGAKVKRWPVPVGKDPGEAFAAGVDIRAWILAGMED